MANNNVDNFFEQPGDGTDNVYNGGGTNKMDIISELTAATGVTVDGVLLKDGTVTTTGPDKIDVNTTITAFATGGQASATALTGQYNNVTTVATAGDSVKLLTDVAGLKQTVKNSGVATLAVFPNTSDSINALAVNLSIDLLPGAEATFIGVDATIWETQEAVTLNAPTTQTGSLTVKATDNAANHDLVVTNASHGQDSTYSIPDSGLATASFVTVTNALTIAEADSLKVSTRHVDTGDVDTHVLLVADSGKTHTIPQVTGDIALTLPAAAAGLEYRVVSAAATAEGDNWVITATNDFIGGLAQVDTDGTAAAVLASGSSTNTCTIVAPLAGTGILMICDGTNWLISGFVLAIAVPTFTDV